MQATGNSPASEDWIASSSLRIAPGSRVLLKDASGNTLGVGELCQSAANPEQLRQMLHGDPLRELQRGARENERLVILEMKKVLAPPAVADAPYSYAQAYPSNAMDVPARIGDMLRGGYYLWDLNRLEVGCSRFAEDKPWIVFVRWSTSRCNLQRRRASYKRWDTS